MSTLRDKLMADLTGGTRVRTGPTLYAPLDNAEIERLVDEFREGGTDIGIVEARAIASLAELVPLRRMHDLGPPVDFRPTVDFGPGVRPAPVEAALNLQVTGLKAAISERDGIIERQRAEIAALRRVASEEVTLERRIEKARAVLMGEID